MHSEIITQHCRGKKQWSGFSCPAEAALHSHSYLEVEGEAKCLVTLAGESDLLTGEPQPGDSVLLSLRRRSFWKFISFRHKLLQPSIKGHSQMLRKHHGGAEAEQSDLRGVGSGLRATLKSSSVVISRVQRAAERRPVGAARGCATTNRNARQTKQWRRTSDRRTWGQVTGQRVLQQAELTGFLFFFYNQATLEKVQSCPPILEPTKFK